MPQIPTYTADSPAAAAQLERFPRTLYAPEPIADPGAVLQRVGRDTAHIADRLDAQQADTETVAGAAKYDAGMTLLHQEVFSDPTVTNPEGEFVKRAQALQKATLAGTNRTDVQAALQSHFNRTFPAAVVNVHFDQLKALGQQQLAQLDQIGDIKSKEAAEAQTPQARQEAIDTYTTLLNRTAGRGMLNPVQKEQKERIFNNLVLEKNMDYLRLTNPQRMWGLEQEGAFQAMDPEKHAQILKRYNDDRTRETGVAEKNFKQTQAEVLKDVQGRANAGLLSMQELDDIARNKNVYVGPEHGPALKARNDDPIVGDGPTRAVQSLWQEYELGWSPSKGAAYVQGYKDQLKHLQENLFGKADNKTLVEFAKKMNSDTRMMLGLGNTEQAKGLQSVTDKVEAAQNEVMPFMKRFTPNNAAVDKAKARDAYRSGGVTPEQAAETVRKQNKAKADGVPKDMKDVLDMVPR